MPCSVTSENDLPDYLKKIIKEIDIGNDDDIKDCLCDLKSYVDTNSKRYTIPYCVYNAVDGGEGQEIFDLLPEVNLTLMPVGDPQKLMELYFKYKSFDIPLSADNGIEVSCQEAGDDSANGKEWSEIVTATKFFEDTRDKLRLRQVCENYPTFFGQTNEMTRDCGEDPTDTPAGTVTVGYGILLFFMQAYEEPECGQPGPVLYIALQSGEGTYSGTFNELTLNINNPLGATLGAVSNPKTWEI